jgi:hypothetical protein
VNRVAELLASPRVGCGDLLGIVVVLLLLWMCHRPRAYSCRIQIFALDCIEYREKLRFLVRAAYRRLLCGLLLLVEGLDLRLDQLCHWFRGFHKCDDATMPNDPI